MAPLSRALALSLVAIVVRAAPVKTQAVLKEQEGPPDLTALPEQVALVSLGLAHLPHPGFPRKIPPSICQLASATRDATR